MPFRGCDLLGADGAPSVGAASGAGGGDGAAFSAAEAVLWPHTSGAGAVAATFHTGKRSPRAVGAAAKDAGSKLELIQLQSLLSQLKDEKVRVDFLAGLIIDLDEPEMSLISLDCIQSLLCPKWVPDKLERHLKISIALQHFDKLSRGSLEIFEIPCDFTLLDNHKYSTWKRAFQKLMESMYWFTQKHCSISHRRATKEAKYKVELSEDESRVSTAAKSKRCKRVKGRKVVTQATESDLSSDEALSIFSKGRSKHLKTNPLLLNKRRAELVEISDSSSEADEESSSDDSLTEVRTSKRRYFPKDVVTPDCFDMDGTQSLKGFLDDYERYFRAKYDGTERDCTKELARFISGEVKDAYDALGGSRLKYRDMRPSLLQWYKAQCVGRTHKFKGELKHTIMKKGETYKLYCMRLQELAHRAYPNDYKECLKQMKRQLTKTVPVWFNKSIEKKEELKVMLKVGKKVTWLEIIEIAERHDRKIRKARLYRGSDDDESDELNDRLANLKCSMMDAEAEKVVSQIQGKLVSGLGQPGTDEGPLNREHSTHYEGDRSPYADKRPAGPNNQCHHCGRMGHFERACWFKTGACTVCGSFAHRYRDCPKFSGVGRGVSAPACFNCNGPHWARECPRKPRSPRGRGRGAPLN